MNPSSYASDQYSKTGDRLAVRLAIHDYNTHSQSWWDWVGHRIQKSGNLLEIGAGTGELWRHVDHAEADLTLTDFSTAMCERLKSIAGAKVVQCDATSLPFSDASFDTVIANHMLYHVDEPEVALKEFARVLRPGGRLLVSLNGADHLRQLIEVGVQVGRYSTGRTHARINAENAADLLTRHFTNVTQERFPGGFEVPIAEPVLAYLSSLDENDLNRKQEALARSIIEPKIASDGSFKINKHMVLFTADRA